MSNLEAFTYRIIAGNVSSEEAFCVILGTGNMHRKVHTVTPVWCNTESGEVLAENLMMQDFNVKECNNNPNSNVNKFLST
jgi:hypothetical protein